MLSVFFLSDLPGRNSKLANAVASRRKVIVEVRYAWQGGDNL